MKCLPFAFLFLIACLRPTVYANDIETALLKANLVKTDIPSKERMYIYSQTLPNYIYCVQLINRKISLVKTEQNQCKNSSIIKTIKGLTFRGTDFGEWGGTLELFSENNNAKILIKDNIRDFYNQKEELIVFTGLTHLSIDRGAIFSVRLRSSDYKAQRITLLPSTPVIVVQDYYNANITQYFIVTSDGSLFLFSPNPLRLRTLTFDQLWRASYATSAIKIRNNIMIGMRGGVLIAKLGEYYQFSGGVEEIIFYTEKR